MPAGYKVHGSGRKIGSLNVITREMKEQLKELAEMQIEAIQNTIDANELRTRNEILRTLLPYLMPRCATKIDVGESPIVVQVHGNI
jgi:hypothetical protein